MLFLSILPVGPLGNSSSCMKMLIASGTLNFARPELFKNSCSSSGVRLPTGQTAMPTTSPTH